MATCDRCTSPLIEIDHYGEPQGRWLHSLRS